MVTIKKTKLQNKFMIYQFESNYLLHYNKIYNYTSNM